jgi:hypothetical protein
MAVLWLGEVRSTTRGGPSTVPWRQVASVAPGPPLLLAGSSGLLARSGGVDGGYRLKDKDQWASTLGIVLSMVLERCGG